THSSSASPRRLAKLTGSNPQSPRLLQLPLMFCKILPLIILPRRLPPRPARSDRIFPEFSCSPFCLYPLGVCSVDGITGRLMGKKQPCRQRRYVFGNVIPMTKERKDSIALIDICLHGSDTFLEI